MRCTITLTALAVAVGMTSHAWAWSEKTHQKLTSDALQSVKWLDQYQSLQVTPFDRMLRDVLGEAKPVGPDAFKFKKASTRKAKHQKYMESTAGMQDANVRQFARHLLLSNQLKFGYGLGEQSHGVSAKQVLSHYSAEPDGGMDKGLDASKHQKLMGGTDPKKTSSQGFRHMSFLFGTMGESPKRAQLAFDLGAKAIKAGHPYWGFRFVAWGMHYLGDMGTPVHTNMLPTLKYIRVKGMVRPEGKLNKSFLKDLVSGSSQINANYHFLYERYVDKQYKGRQAEALSAAVRGDGKRPNWFQRTFAPRSVKSVAKRNANTSRFAAFSVARNAVRLFTDKFRRPADNAPSNSVMAVDKQSVARAVAAVDRPLPNESQRAYSRRMRAQQTMMRRTDRVFRKTGVSMRRAMGLLHKQIR